MTRVIVRPADTPVEAYLLWHRKWCQILSRNHAADILAAGLGGLSFTERTLDAPGGRAYFSYAISRSGEINFIEGEGMAVAEYDSYELGLRMLSDGDFDTLAQIESGSFRIISHPQAWAALMALLPILRHACHIAIEETEKELDIELPKYW